MVLMTSPLFIGGKKPPVEFVSSSISTSVSSPNSVTAPSGIAAGDLLLLVGASNGVTVTSAPSGWDVQLNESPSTPAAIVYTKIATGSEPSSYSWSLSSSTGNGLAILCYRNATGIDVLGSRTRASSNTSTAPTITPTRKGVLVGVFALNRGASTISTAPSDMTSRASEISGSYCLAVYDASPSLVAATTARTLMWANSGANVGWQIQIY
jgi:hypothetical protein